MKMRLVCSGAGQAHLHVGGVAVRLIGGGLHLVLNPLLNLIGIAKKLLQTASILERLPPGASRISKIFPFLKNSLTLLLNCRNRLCEHGIMHTQLHV